MSKSYGNTIDLFLEEKALRKQVMRIVTDATPVEDPKDPDKCNVFKLYSLFLDQDEESALRQRYSAGGLSYGAVKQELFETIRDYFEPHRAKRLELLADLPSLRNTLAQGADKARYIAMKTLRKVRKKVGSSY